MRYFIQSNSFAAPIISDTATAFVEANSPSEALERYAARYSHPAGLYAASAYADANAYHEGAQPLARYLSNHELHKQRLTRDKPAYSYYGESPGKFEIDGESHCIENPKGGRVVR